MQPVVSCAPAHTIQSAQGLGMRLSCLTRGVGLKSAYKKMYPVLELPAGGSATRLLGSLAQGLYLSIVVMYIQCGLMP